MKQYKDTPYFITEDGNVFRNNKQLKPNISKSGYKKLDISICGIRKTTNIHRMLAETYIENPKKKCCVNHIDGDKLNNNLSNLEWVTEKENQIHRYHQLGKGIRSDAHQSKLSEDDIKFIRKNYVARHKEFSQGALARKFGVNQKTIWCVIHNVTWVDHSPEPGPPYQYGIGHP